MLFTHKEPLTALNDHLLRQFTNQQTNQTKKQT